MPECTACGRTVTPDEIGATRKLINRGATEYCCLPCLSQRFEVTEELLRQKIEEWRAYGCSLFPPRQEETGVKN